MKILLAVTTLAFCMHAVLCQMGQMGMSGSLAGMGLATMTGDLSPADYMILDNAVKSIVGPNATPTPMMIMLAQRQGSPPKTMAQVMPYISMMQGLARSMNIQPAGVKGKATPEQINNHVRQRAMKWYQNRMALGMMMDTPFVPSSMMGTNTAAAGSSATGNQQNDLFNMMAMANMF